MKRRLLVISLLTLCLVAPSLAQRRRRSTPRVSNGCELRFKGSVVSRKAVKLRPAGLDYPFHNGGRAISVADFFAFVCTLDEDVPTKSSDIPRDEPMEAEKVKIKLRGFVLAMKKDPDNDLHIQIGDTARPYKQQQLIVEIPPGADYCDARTKMMELFRADGGTNISNHPFKKPPLVEVTGYLFLDSHHKRRGRTDYCTFNGGRGIKNGLRKSPVRGIWEIHPVFELKKIGR